VGPELLELWREHDSTGLRAKPKLKHTALAVRVARKHTRSSASLPRRHSHTQGKPSGFPFLMRIALRRGSTPVMVGGRAVLAHVTVV
jgi:hypothetical protein